MNKNVIKMCMTPAAESVRGGEVNDR
jgi:hypothetical protein